jgi:hypothetical protein
MSPFNFLGRWSAQHEAQDILGKERVIFQSQSKKVLRAKRIEPIEVTKSRAVLEWCAEQNSQGADWVLFGELGLSFTELKQLKPLAFCNTLLWRKPSCWMQPRRMPRYRLINRRMLLLDHPGVCTKLLFKNGERARLETIAELAIISHAIGDENKMFLKEQFHSSLITRDNLTILGNYDHEGMILQNLPQSAFKDWGMPGIGAIVCRSLE